MSGRQPVMTLERAAPDLAGTWSGSGLDTALPPSQLAGKLTIKSYEFDRFNPARRVGAHAAGRA